MILNSNAHATLVFRWLFFLVMFLIKEGMVLYFIFETLELRVWLLIKVYFRDHVSKKL